MRYYPNQDIHFYVEKLDWQRCCRNPCKSWKPNKRLDKVPFINYWRDLEGAKKDIITNKDLYFDNWMTTRINRNVCLPIYYAVGNRFIKIQKAPPAGFKCALVPINLAEARIVKAKIKEEKKQERKERKLQRLARKKAKREAKLKQKKK